MAGEKRTQNLSVQEKRVNRFVAPRLLRTGERPLLGRYPARRSDLASSGGIREIGLRGERQVRVAR